MKKSITSALLLLCFSMTACAPQPNTKPSTDGKNGSQSKPGSQNLKSYRFQSAAAKCDTYERSFATKEELCFAIQVDELNNEGCAATERREHFDKHCSAITNYDPLKAKDALIHVNGKYVDCTYSETELPEIRQYTATRQLFMAHTLTRAQVWHDLRDSKIVLHMSLYDNKSNKLLNKIERHFQDETETVILTAPIASGNAVLTCLVNLADDPNRN